MRLVAVMDKIFVKELVKKETTTEGGIVLIEEVAQKQEPQKCGVVVSVGSKVPYDLKRGDIIVFHQMAGQAMIFDKEIYRIIKADEVYGILIDDKLHGCTCEGDTCELEDDEYPVEPMDWEESK